MESVYEVFQRVKTAHHSVAEVLQTIEERNLEFSKEDIKKLMFAAREIHETSVVLSYQKYYELELQQEQNTPPQQATENSVSATKFEANETAQKEVYEEEFPAEKVLPIEKSDHPESQEQEDEFAEANNEAEESYEAQLASEINSTIEEFSAESDKKKSWYDKFKKDTKEDNSIASKLTKNKISDLHSHIGINEKFLFVNQLFNGNTEEFMKCLAKLNNFETGNEAIAYLQKLTEEKGWKTDAKAFIILNDLVKRRYH